MYLALVLLSIVSGAPLLWLLVTSVKKRQEVFLTFLPGKFDLSSYARVWSDLNLAHHFWNSAILIAGTLIIVIFSSTLAAYAFAKLDFPGKNLLYYILIIAMTVPGHAVLIPMFVFLKSIALLDTLYGLSASLLGLAIPISVLILRAYFISLPNELGDAARIDGASELEVFLRIYLPLLRPGLAAVAIFQFVAIWNEFLFSTVLILDPSLKTIQPSVYRAVGRYSTDYPLLAAGLIITLLPVATVFIIMQNRIVDGLIPGALEK